MRKLLFLVLSAMAAVKCDIKEKLLELRVADSSSDIFSKGAVDDVLTKTDLVTAFVVFRHGDRTPDQEELDLYPAWKIEKEVFFPYGKKALTLKGKQRAYTLGDYLRKLYNYDVNQIYLPEEISVRSTDYARTKMSALAVLAGLYKPLPLQKWHPEINWQPIPYDTVPSNIDDLLYFNNCPQYEILKHRVYDIPAVRNMINAYESLFKLLSANTETNITTPEDVFFLDNLFQAMQNVDVTIPQWAQDIMPQIKNMTKIEYYCQYYNTDLVRLASGVLVADIIDITNAAVAGNKKPAKLYLYSGHELNVAALLAAIRVFVPHQPNYRSSVSLELRRNHDTGKYGVMVVHTPETGIPGHIQPIADCGGELICDYDKFVALTQDLLLSREEYKKLCSI